MKVSSSNMCELQNSEYGLLLTERVCDEALYLPAQAVEETVPESWEWLAPKASPTFQFYVSIIFIDHILKSEKDRSSIWKPYRVMTYPHLSQEKRDLFSLRW